MALDAFDPGPNGDYPNFPRDADGYPCWEGDGRVPVHGAPMPRGVHRHRNPHTGEIVLIDLTPRDAEGNPINPPVIPPA